MTRFDEFLKHLVIFSEGLFSVRQTFEFVLAIIWANFRSNNGAIWSHWLSIWYQSISNFTFQQISGLGRLKNVCFEHSFEFFRKLSLTSCLKICLVNLMSVILLVSIKKEIYTGSNCMGRSLLGKCFNILEKF